MVPLSGCKDLDDTATNRPTGSSAAAAVVADTPSTQPAATPSKRLELVPTSQKSVLHDTGGLTDNETCLVCHVDLEKEEMVVQHLKGQMICPDCHGASEAHRSDELNITKPDVLYGRSQIDEFCKTCHLSHKTGDVYHAFLKEWYGKRRPNGRMVVKDSVCTDCHGNHAILRPEHQAAQ